MTSKKNLSERDICTQYILPAITKAGWNLEKQIREEVFFTDGRIFVKGNKTARGERKRADVVLYHKPNIPIAVVEAKDNNHSVGAGLQQVLDYAEILDIPVAFSSNGDGFIEHDRSGTGSEIERTNYNDDKDAYRQFSQDFFDLVVVDECHRGSASADSAWREMLSYFSSATQIGLTATPKETKDVSNIEYFGDSLYTYSLRQGIDDGFLAPYKVIRVGLNVGLEGYRPEAGKLDDGGNPVEDRIYNNRDFDKNLVIDERTRAVAHKITEFLRKTSPKDKTIVFCIDIEHAERMRRALVNENPDQVAKSLKYVMRITGDDDLGKRELDNFINPEEDYPVIATTSKLMTTGVGAQTCKLIVLDSNINSMTEFKQIIGRGTRINEEFGKQFFTIMDFRNVTDLFADPAFDGDPVVVKDVSGVDVSILNERIQHLDADGRLITESLKEYTRKGILREFRSLEDFLSKWNGSNKKSALIEELEKYGLIIENLKEEITKELDVFDLVCHVAWDMPPLSRRERAKNVRKRNYFTKYGDQARAVLEALLDKYATKGIENIEDIGVLRVETVSGLGTPSEIVAYFGGKDNYLTALKELEQEIYRMAA